MEHRQSQHKVKQPALSLPKLKDCLNPHSTGRRFRYAHGDLGIYLKLFQIAAEA